MRQACRPPNRGWFAVDERWPTEDPDSTVFARYLGARREANGGNAEGLLCRVLDGLHRLSQDP